MKYNYDLDQITPTKNNRGVSLVILDEYQQLFIKEISSKAAKVLEIGAGYGYLTSHLVENEYEVTCSNIEKKHLHVVANKPCKETQSKLDIVCSPAQNLGFPSNRFDAIDYCMVLNFLKNKGINDLFIV